MTRRAPRTPPPVSPALWLAAGAAAGVLVGIAITDRATPLRRLLRNAGSLLPTLSGLLQLADRRGAPATDDDLDDAEFDAGDVDDDAVTMGDDDGFDDGDDEEWEEVLDGIDARVLAAYDADPLLATLPIEIDAPEPGTITLDGTVLSARLIAHAVTIARGTPGVERVEHHLVVRRPRRPSTGATSGR